MSVSLSDGIYVIGLAATQDKDGEPFVKIFVKDNKIENAFCNYSSKLMGIYPKVAARYILKSGLCAPLNERIEGYSYWILTDDS